MAAGDHFIVTYTGRDPLTNAAYPPAVPIAEAKRQMLMIERLPEMRKQIRALRAEVEELRKRVEGEARDS